MATALLALATSGCVDPLDDSLKPQPEEPTLTFWIHVPGSVLATKANPGDVASISPESMIYDVQVWVFDHNKTDGATKPLNYVYKDIAGGFQYSPNITIDDTPEVVANKIWEAAYKIQMPLPKEFVLGTDPCVDFYILANWQSIFNNKPAGDLTLAEVRDMVFGAGTKANAYFGTSAPTTAVPSVDVGEGDNQETQVLGLPISTVYKGANGDGVSLEFLKRAYLGLEDEDDNKVNVIDNDLFKRKLGVIELERAVSKVRFVFAKPEGMNNVEITKIVINSGVIPTSTYTFPNSHSEFYPGGDSQVFEDAAELVGATANVPLLASGDIIGVTDPEILSSNCERVPTGYQVSPKSMEAQEYDDYLTNATSGVKPSTAKLIYFRETDNAIEGTIHYKIDGVAKEPKPFKMTVVSNDVYNNFHRNHYWTVYAYFRGGGLYIKPVVLPWEEGSLYTYTQRGSAVVAISTKKETLFGYGWSTSASNDWYKAKVVSCVTQYNASADGNMGTWTDTAPTDPTYFTNNKYFWTRSMITLNDGSVNVTAPVSKAPYKDENEVEHTVSGITVEYAISTDNRTKPESGWVDAATLTSSLSLADSDSYIWSRTTTSYTDQENPDTDYTCIKITKDFTEWYFRRQDEAYTNNWAYDWLHSQIVSAPVLNAGGAPIYANRIELRTNGFNVPLRLKLSNPEDFYIVTYNAASANYVSWTVETQPDGYNEADGALIPADISYNGTTYFYVVPKVGTEHEGKTTKAYLVTAPTNGSGSQKLPFNAGVFPGSNENTEIYFYSVSVETFKSYYTDPLPDNIRPYDKSGVAIL